MRLVESGPIESSTNITEVLKMIGKMMQEAGATLPNKLGRESYLVNNKGIIEGTVCYFDYACVRVYKCNNHDHYAIEANYDFYCAESIYENIGQIMDQFRLVGTVWTDVDPEVIGSTIQKGLINQKLPSTLPIEQDIEAENLLIIEKLNKLNDRKS